MLELMETERKSSALVFSGPLAFSFFPCLLGNFNFDKLISNTRLFFRCVFVDAGVAAIDIETRKRKDGVLCCSAAWFWKVGLHAIVTSVVSLSALGRTPGSTFTINLRSTHSFGISLETLPWRTKNCLILNLSAYWILHC